MCVARIYRQTKNPFVHLHVDHTHHHDHAGQHEDGDDGDDHEPPFVPDILCLLLPLHQVVVEVPVEVALCPAEGGDGLAHHWAVAGLKDVFMFWPSF